MTAGPSSEEVALRHARTALAGTPSWLVGGAVRDRLLGRSAGAAPPADLDVVVFGDVAAAAAALAREARGPRFALSDAFGSWRVLAPDRRWQVDLSPLRGLRIEDDLALRDLTVNAIAEPLDGGARVDPHGGAGDVAAARLRAVGPRAFADDPLRVVRLARLACELDMAPDPGTVTLARDAAPGVAGVAAERVFAEVKRIVAAPRALEGLRRLDELGLTPVLLPELHALRGVQQTVYHHRDVHGHTLEVLERVIALQQDPAAILGEEHAGAVLALLAEPLADELDRGTALRLGALLHDAAKPLTQTPSPKGGYGFPGHDRAGADVARDVLTRMRASERLREHVAALARHHLRLGFLVHEMPLGRRPLFRYLRATEPVEVDVTLLSLCDRLATRGRRADEAIARHAALVHGVLGEALAWRARGRLAPLVRGDELADALHLPPGPDLGRLLSELEEARFAGEIATPEEALALAARLHAHT